jgi:hypothetical protein
VSDGGRPLDLLRFCIFDPAALCSAGTTLDRFGNGRPVLVLTERAL